MEEDTSCCPRYLFQRPRQHNMRLQECHDVLCLPLHCYLQCCAGGRSAERIQCSVQERHRAGKATPFKGLDFSFQLLSSFLIPLILIINSMPRNFSLNHPHNIIDYVGNKKYLKEGSTCLPRSQQHASSLPVWFSLQADFTHTESKQEHNF